MSGARSLVVCGVAAAALAGMGRAQARTVMGTALAGHWRAAVVETAAALSADLERASSVEGYAREAASTLEQIEREGPLVREPEWNRMLITEFRRLLSAATAAKPETYEVFKRDMGARLETMGWLGAAAGDGSGVTWRPVADPETGSIAVGGAVPRLQERLDAAHAAASPEGARAFFDGGKAGGDPEPEAVFASASAVRATQSLYVAADAQRPAESAAYQVVAAPRVDTVPRPRPSGIGAGLANGAREGYALGSGIILYPAVSLLSEGFSRSMSRYYDGGRSDNGRADAYAAAGWVLAALTFIPSVAVGVLFGLGGAVAGAGAEVASPGSTDSWDGIGVLAD